MRARRQVPTDLEDYFILPRTSVPFFIDLMLCSSASTGLFAP